MTTHCSTCRCDEVTAERWFPGEGRRCSTCSWRVNNRGLSVVLRVTDRGARRYLCRTCAEAAGWDGTFTPTSTDRLLKAQDAYRNGGLSLIEYLSEIDRATEQGVTDQALHDADDAHVPALPDGVYLVPDPDPNGGSITTVRVGDVVSFDISSLDSAAFKFGTPGR